jgi:hypothetical protein
MREHVKLQNSGSGDSFLLLPCTEKMEKTEIRAVIKYFIKKGMKAKEIHADFQNTPEGLCSFIFNCCQVDQQV